jgi:hypothetical protein
MGSMIGRLPGRIGNESGSSHSRRCTKCLDQVKAITEPFTDSNGDLSVMASSTGNDPDLVRFNRDSAVWGHTTSPLPRAWA